MNEIKEVHLNPNAFKDVIIKVLQNEDVTSQLDPKAKFIPNTTVPEGIVVFLNSSGEIHGSLALCEELVEVPDNSLGSLEVIN
jgi:hypothetical protein